ncbi:MULTISPECIES: RNA polymerase sigma factor [Niastella]|uniref:Sigma-70 family RNA polymerase sigma factor n=1 Tax=Niastella soli TaxID=2821487 RepID=A0ABS3Z0L1_9BACT|nr:sigma-70 family RNA polymerase sigma factor [Niastella soli]MBO9203707.1 sigma-70 family RNA polymerase sigma factor [Niastella soli]
MKETSDNDLLMRISEGDRHAFRELYQRYTPVLYPFIKSVCNNDALCEDIVQEVFIKLWDNRSNASNIKQVKPYLFKAAKNRFLNELRKQKNERTVINNRLYNEIDPETPEQQLTFKEGMRLGNEALSRLSPKRRLIVEMSTREELSLDEISSRVGSSKNVVKKLLYQGLAMMKKYEIIKYFK